MPVTIRDPIHGSVVVDDWALPLVESPVMQRLRRVGQLGTASLVYPGANHKRFEHSLGAHHLAGRLAVALGLGDEDARVVRAAALLHDVGHGPFSHAFEELLHEEGGRHEETTVDLVRWGPLADLLRRSDVDPVAVAEAVLGEGPLASVVSGPIDADRMDFLLRDAHYTGVRSSADPDRLAAVLEMDAQHGVVLRESGINAAEGLLSTRFLMYPSVYLHHTVRSSESMLLAAVRAYVDEGHAGLKELERETDDGLLHRMRGAGGVAAGLVERLDNRRLYKRAFEGRPDRYEDPQVQDLIKNPKARLEVAARIADRAGVPVHHVVLDTPRPPKFRELGIRVRLRDGGTVPLAEASRLVRVMDEARMDHWRFWVFAPRRDRDAVAKAAEAELS